MAITDDKNDKCTECEGIGYWEYPTISRVAKVSCKVCNGTGKISFSEIKD